MQPFWVSVVSFHAALLAVTWGLAWKWRAAPSGPGWLGWTLRQAALWTGAALALAGLCSLLGYQSGFMVIRLLAQALFGELPALALLLAAWTVRRHGAAGAAIPLSVCLALVAVYVEAYHRGPTDLRLRRHTHDVTAGRPKTGVLRILHLSDLQTPAIGPHEERALRLAAAQPADLVLWTGDYVQPRLARTRDQAEVDLRALLAAIPFRAPLGVYAVRGDVDRHWPRPLAGTGITLLGGESVRLPLSGGRFLSLAGLTPGMSRGHHTAALVQLVASLPAEDVHVVFGHNPDFTIALADQAPVTLALAGHTHGGQVVLPFFGPPYTKSRLPRSLASGLGHYRGQALHVSAGIGMERGPAPQVRFRCPPEICLIDLVY
jgi:predicted MPP superfamily phosphohydrolase